MKRFVTLAGNLAAVLLVTLLSAGPVQATGFMVARFGGEHGTPMTSDPTAIYYNPAGIAFATGTNVYVEAMTGYRTETYDRDPGSIDNPNKTPGTPDVAVNSGKGNLMNLLASPFFGATSDLGVKNLGVGVAFSTPFGGNAVFDKNNAYAGNARYPGAVDGAQRWSEIEGTIRSSYISAAGAYRLPGNVSIGLSFNVVMSVINDIRAYNADGSDDVVTGSGGLQEGRALLDASNTTFSIGAGVVWQATPELVVGLSYQSQPGFGEMKLSGTAQKKLGSSTANTDQVEVTEGLPDVIRLGVGYKVMPTVELRAWGSYERWSTFGDQCILNATVADRNCALDANGQATAAAKGIMNNIPRHWMDAIDLRLSGSWWLSPTLELQAGLGFDGNAVPDNTLEAGLPDQNKASASLGAATTLLGGKLQLTASYTQFVFFSRTVAPRPRDSGGEPVAPYVGVSRVPDMGGTLDESVGLLTISGAYRF